MLSLSVALSVRGSTLRVPSEYSRIASAIDAAFEGDTVLVAPGTYTGPGNRDIQFYGKDIVLLSEGGPEVTIIDCQARGDIHHRGFDLSNGETSATEIE